MRRFFARKLLFYAVTFVVAVTIDWLIPRLAPGDPVRAMVGADGLCRVTPRRDDRALHAGLRARRPHLGAVPQLLGGTPPGQPGHLRLALPAARHAGHLATLPYTLALLVPAILLAFWAGNKFGAYAAAARLARWRRAAGRLHPHGHARTCGWPSCWPGCSGTVLHVFPIAGAYGLNLSPALTLRFAESLFLHWFLPFLSLFLVGFGGWAIGMRNLIIYELDADYSRYLQSLGAPTKLVRKYAYRNALLPQLTGLALSLGRHRRRRARDRGRLLVPRPRLPDACRPSTTATTSCSRASSCSSSSACSSPTSSSTSSTSSSTRASASAWRETDERGRGPQAGGRPTPSTSPVSADDVAQHRPGASGASREFLYFAARDRKIFISLAIIARCSSSRLVGPRLREYGPNDYVGPAAQAPSSEYWFGTTIFGQDVFVQFVHGVGATFFVGLVGGGLAALVGMTVGFVAGYRGGLVDEVLNMLTNVVLVIPTLMVLIVVVAYVDARGLLVEAVFIGLTSWPWAARAIRAQTLSLRSREFVDLAPALGSSRRARSSWARSHRT